MKNATRAFLLLVCISFTYLGCTPEEIPTTEVQAPIPTQTVPPTIESFSPQSAFAGEQVTINGTGFGQLPIGIQVFFGDVEAQVVSASSTKIVVVVPEGAEEEKIQVKAEGGQAFTDEAFTVFDFDMYIVGSNAQIWKNNILQESIAIPSNPILNGIQSLENDIYLLGTNNNQIGVWKNQEPLPIDLDVFSNSSSEDIFVSEMEVAIVGRGVINGTLRGTLWRGSNSQTLPVAFVGEASTEFSAIAINHGSTFIVGRTNVFNSSSSSPTVWVNNTSFPLPLPITENKGGKTEDIAIANNGTEYIVGKVFSNKPIIWINRELNVLPLPGGLTPVFMEITAVTVDENGNYYVIGYVNDSDGVIKAVIWKNGIFSFLSNDIDSFSLANDVTVFRDDIYVVGTIGGQAVVWKNGEPTYLGAGRANAIAITEK